MLSPSQDTALTTPTPLIEGVEFHPKFRGGARNTSHKIRASQGIRANRLRVPELNPFFLANGFPGTKSCKSQVSGDSLERYENVYFCESIRAYRTNFVNDFVKFVNNFVNTCWGPPKGPETSI